MRTPEPGGQPPSRISIIIPTWRDADNLARLLPKIAPLKGVAEIIVVNASRESGTELIAQRFGALCLKSSPPNRGAQMNAGAAIATGDVLLFQHADTHLEQAHIDAILRALRDRDNIGGAFYRQFDGRHPHLLWLEPVARFFSRHGGTLFGDQSVFVRRATFARLGGFAPYPLMEDVEFSRRLRAAPGQIVLLDPPVHSSARHHLRKGAWRMTLRNALFLVLYRSGVSPIRLHRWYYPAPEVPQGKRTSGRRVAVRG